MRVPDLRYPDGPTFREPAELEVPNLVCEEIRHVSTGRVVLADYEVIQHDFPELTTASLVLQNPELALLQQGELNRAVHRIIDNWLIAKAAFVSASQAAQEEANTSIHTDGSAVGYRPPRYDRALVVALRTDPTPRTSGGRWPNTMKGLLDLKGAGVGPGKVPGDRQTTNGLEYLGWALYDYLIKRAVDAIFEREQPTLSTVPVYAVVDLGFDVLKGWFGRAPAGLHVRRAHRRALGVAHLSECHVDVAIAIEQALRKYGVTARSRPFLIEIEEVGGHIIGKSANTTKTIVEPGEIGLCLQLLRGGTYVAIDRVELQLARGTSCPPPTAQMYDFGALEVVDDFTGPWCEKSALNSLRVVWPDSIAYVRPEPELRLPFEVWRRPALMRRCLGIAAGFRSGKLSRGDVRNQLDEPLGEIVMSWQKFDSRMRTFQSKAVSASHAALST